MSTALELRSSRGENPSFSVLFADAKKYWLRLLGVFILMGIIIGVGLILLIVPGIIAIKRLLYAPYMMIDKDLGIVDSLNASNELSKKHSNYTWAAFGVMILIALIAGFISALPFIGWLIGAVVAVAYSLVVPLRYLQLKKLPSHKHA
jgi:membrane-anchored glycerophosphoryl diester phosphodiesterase (GDPDase)